MKRLVVTMSDETELTDDMKEKVEQFAKMHHATPAGIIQYPDGIPVMMPQILIEGLKMTEANYVMSASTDFLIGELAHDCFISKSLEKQGVEVYELDFGLKINEVVNFVSPDIKHDIKELVDEKLEFSDENERQSILIVSKEQSPLEMIHYASTLINEDTNPKVGQLQVHEFNKNTVERIKEIIETESINEVIFYDEFDTQEYEKLIDELQCSDIELSFRSEQQTAQFTMKMN